MGRTGKCKSFQNYLLESSDVFCHILYTLSDDVKYTVYMTCYTHNIYFVPNNSMNVLLRPAHSASCATMHSALVSASVPRIQDLSAICPAYLSPFGCLYRQYILYSVYHLKHKANSCLLLYILMGGRGSFLLSSFQGFCSAPPVS
jgi:hypothetical protein